MNTNQIILAIVSFGLGITAKYADLYNEHGLRPPFKGMDYLCGILWGLFGMGMVMVSPLGGLTYIAHVLYWFVRIKLEYPNHAFAGVIMVLSGFYFQGEFLYTYRVDLVGVFLAYLITGYIQSYFKENFPASKLFWRLRLRIYIIPIVYALYRQSLDPIIATGFGMIACEWITLSYRKYADDVRTRTQII